jgi:hypothetical protein
MKVIFINTLMTCMLSVTTGILKGQSPGSEETLLGFFAIAPGGTTASVSETIYIGPGTYEIEGTWEIYSKNVVIDPAAVITGNGTIQFFNPSLAGGTASPTIIDGNGSSNAIEVNLVHNNAQGIQLSNIDFPADLVNAGFTNNIGSATTYIGKDLSLAVDGADITLGISVTGDLVFDSDATISSYRPERMIITNNSIVSHVVKEWAGSGFIFPVGIADGDYTPAQVTGNGTIHVSVQDYGSSASNEGSLTGGPERTWHIYADAETVATVALQHNSSTDVALFDSGTAHFVTQYSGTSWSSGTEESGLAGTFTTGASPIPGASIQDLAGVTIAASASGGTSYLTKTNTNALPVTLSSFQVYKEGQTGVIQWSTTEETNSDRFEIQRSTDAKKWIIIGEKTARGESKNVATYSFIDNAPANDINYYRLKMVDKDATFTFSRIRSMNFAGGIKLVLYPNPVSDMLFMDGINPDQIEKVEVISLNGNTMITSVTQSKLDLRSFSTGVYSVRVTLKNDAQITQKIVVSK